MKSISVKTLQERFGLRFGEAEKLLHKIEKLRYTKPRAKLDIGLLDTGENTKLIISLDFKKPSIEAEQIK